MHIFTLRGVDDSLYQHYPGFEGRMREALRLLLGEEVEKLVVMGLAKDGSEVGGAYGFFSWTSPIIDVSFCLFSRTRCIASDETWQNCNLRKER
jgi:Hexokinase